MRKQWLWSHTENDTEIVIEILERHDQYTYRSSYSHFQLH